METGYCCGTLPGACCLSWRHCLHKSVFLSRFSKPDSAADQRLLLREMSTLQPRSRNLSLRMQLIEMVVRLRGERGGLCVVRYSLSYGTLCPFERDRHYMMHACWACGSRPKTAGLRSVTGRNAEARRTQSSCPRTFLCALCASAFQNLTCRTDAGTAPQAS
jgi:hypothetical protein